MCPALPYNNLEGDNATITGKIAHGHERNRLAGKKFQTVFMRCMHTFQIDFRREILTTIEKMTYRLMPAAIVPLTNTLNAITESMTPSTLENDTQDINVAP